MGITDINGVEHEELGIEREPGLGHIQPDQTIKYDDGLLHYYVDGEEISETEFYKLFPQYIPEE